jgi:hypothetical protein
MIKPKSTFEIDVFLFYSVLKDRKKTDKTIIDSQERAFWRVMRPSVRSFLYIFVIITYEYS